MRRLAARLNEQAPALYRHVGEKAGLLGLMVGEIYAGAHGAAGDMQDWCVWLVAFGRAMHDKLARHRDGARLCAIAVPPINDQASSSASAIARLLVLLGLARSGPS